MTATIAGIASPENRIPEGGIVETWQIVATLLLSVGALLTPIVLAARSRDTALMTMISSAKEDASRQMKAATDPLHERVNRVRDEYVRRDDLDGHLLRVDKRFDEIHHHMQRNADLVDKRFTELIASMRK